jgi:hypothetical protein
MTSPGFEPGLPLWEAGRHGVGFESAALFCGRLLCRMPSFGMLHCVTLVRTDVLEKRIASIIRVRRLGQLGTTLAITSNLSTLQRNICNSDDGDDIFFRSDVTSQKTTFFIVTAVKTSDLTQH